MLAAELLAFGTGSLRARNDDPAERIHHHLWGQYGPAPNAARAVYARIGLCIGIRSWLNRIQKESFDSTNLIYGHVFRRARATLERRAGHRFSGQVAQGLEPLPERTLVASLSISAARAWSRRLPAQRR